MSKMFIASDIHGDAQTTEKLLRRYRESGAEKLVLLGDVLYHGPRNDLPEGYAPKKVIELLNPFKNEILAVRGNCDVYSKLPLEESLQAEDKSIFITHGHLYGVKSSTERLMYAGVEREADIILFGHTHEGLCEYVDEECFGRPFYLVNPGSIAQPMYGNPTFAVIEIRNSDVLVSVAPLY